MNYVKNIFLTASGVALNAMLFSTLSPSATLPLAMLVNTLLLGKGVIDLTKNEKSKTFSLLKTAIGLSGLALCAHRVSDIFKETIQPEEILSEEILSNEDYFFKLCQNQFSIPISTERFTITDISCLTDTPDSNRDFVDKRYGEEKFNSNIPPEELDPFAMNDRNSLFKWRKRLEEVIFGQYGKKMLYLDCTFFREQANCITNLNIEKVPGLRGYSWNVVDKSIEQDFYEKNRWFFKSLRIPSDPYHFTAVSCSLGSSKGNVCAQSTVHLTEPVEELKKQDLQNWWQSESTRTKGDYFLSCKMTQNKGSCVSNLDITLPHLENYQWELVTHNEINASPLPELTDIPEA